MARKAIYIVLVLVVAAVLFWIFSGKKIAPLAYKDLVRVTTPAANEIVSSPLVVEGEARGFWYFEASFPIKLYDGAGKELAVTVAQARPPAGGDWMTENYVPFGAKLEFSKPATDTGTLVLEKDNPSGLPEQADAVRIRVRF